MLRFTAIYLTSIALIATAVSTYTPSHLAGSVLIQEKPPTDADHRGSGR